MSMKFLPGEVSSELLSEFAAIGKTNAGRCWAPGLNCDRTPIRAHSIQNSRILEALQERNVVTKIVSKIVERQPQVVFSDVGRNNATTFRGLCAEHDAQIFLPLDKGSLTELDIKKMSLLTWRAITHEMSEKLAMAVTFQQKTQDYNWIAKMGNQARLFAGYEAVEWMKVLHDFFIYRSENLDPIIMTGQNSTKYRFKHFLIKQTGPVLASASFFCLDSTEETQLALNVFPAAEDTHVIFGYSKDHTAIAAQVVRSTLTGKLIDTAKLSALILSRTHNVVFKPSIVASWPNQKKQSILSAFGTTIDNYSPLAPTANLDLFA